MNSTRLFPVLTLVILVLAIISCGTDASPTATTQPTVAPTTAPAIAPTRAPAATSAPAATATSAPAPTATTAPTVAPHSGIVPGSKLVMAFVNLGPGGGSFKNFEDSKPSGLPIYDPLIRLKAPLGEAIPGAIASWTVNGALTDWTFTLQKGIKFQDGVEADAGDLLYSIDLFRDKRYSGGTPSFYQRSITSIEIVGAGQVRMQLNTARLLALPLDFTINQPTYLLNKRAIDKLGEDVFYAKPVSSGPYKATDVKFGEIIKYQAWPDYWGPKAHYEQMEMRQVPEDATRIGLLSTGQADVINIAAPTLNQVQGKAGMTVIFNKNTIWTSIKFGNLYLPTRPGYDANLPWMKKEVREALNLAVDRAAVIKTIYQGTAERHDAPFLAPVTVGWNEAKDMWSNPIPFDPARAKQLLASAGYPQGFAMTVAQPSAPGDTPELPALTEAVVGEWRKNLGLNVTIVPIPADKAQNPTKRESAPWLIPARDSTDAISTVRLIQFPPSELTGYYDIGGDELNNLWLPLKSATSEAQAAPAAAAMSRYLRDNWAVVPLTLNPTYFGVRSDKVADWPLVGGVPWPHHFELITIPAK